jgi:hypothetical protein
MTRASDQILLESVWKLSHEAKSARRALAGAAIVIVFQWAIIVWLAWFRKGC